MATKKAQKEQERQDAIKRLRKILKPGMTLYTVCKSVSGSGMYRHIAVIAATKKRHEYDEAVSNISGDVSTVLDWKWHDDGSVGVGGCGMDMGFHVVYSLASALFRDGWKCPGKNCGDSSHHWREGQPKVEYGSGTVHTNGGGYALKQRWL